MKDYKLIKSEISQLVELGNKIYMALKNDSGNSCVDLQFFLLNYEVWYTKALAVIKQITPDRVQDFTILYFDPKRKVLDVSTYCVSDALRTIQISNHRYGPWTAALCVLRQINMLKVCLEKFDSKIFDIRTILQADIFDSELESAKHLLKMGFLRAAGAICGVILEKHFRGVCESRSLVIKKKNPTIADYNDALKDCAYDTVEWRRVQRLGDIRNLCDHSKDREPTKEEVEELISGTERMTKTIY